MSAVLYDPRSQMTQFREAVNAKHGLQLTNYADLYAWSIADIPAFWAEMAQFGGITMSEPASEILDTDVPMEQVPKWFKGAKLNFAQNLLFPTGADKTPLVSEDKTALIFASEEFEDAQVTFGELRELVRVFAAALVEAGVGVGDRVAGYMPSCIETVVATLATISLGAVWTSSSPDFGVTGVLNRFVQVEPKVLLSVNSVRYNGKVHNHLDKLASVVAGLGESGVSPKIVILDFVPAAATPADVSDYPELSDSCPWPAFLAPVADSSRPLEFEQLPFHHPIYILYSSGTTGTPKCLVHSAGGTLIQHLKEHMLHGDLRSTDTVFWFASAQWMMWNWLISGLAVGATVVLWEGSPLYPRKDVLFDMIDRTGTSVFGVSPKYLQVVQDSGCVPAQTHSLATLRAVLSTGAVLDDHQFDFVYSAIKPNVVLGSITGGTDIISCFAGNNPDKPVVRGEIQGLNLGMAVSAFNAAGEPVFDERGDLVCTAPFPSMPVYFWNDDDGARYKAAYFAKFPGVWSHGDFMIISSSTGGIRMLGRSDGTLNPSGVRFGSAEIYHVLDSVDAVADSVVVGQQWDGDERVVLFVKLANGSSVLDDDTRAAIKLAIRSQLSPRHVPAVILPIADVLYTINGKKVEVAIKRILGGADVGQFDRSAYANPEALDLFVGIPELTA